jgi:hypothetical protein
VVDAISTGFSTSTYIINNKTILQKK